MMELTPAGQMRYNSRINSPVSTEAKPAETGTKKSVVSAAADKLSISQAAIAFIEEQKRLQEVQQKKAQMEDTGDGGMTDMIDEQLKAARQCQKIASRIMAGDKVPPKDMQYLMEHDIKAYQMAMAARMIPSKKKPKEWDSALEDEEDTSGSETGGEAEGTTEPAAAEPSGDGGSSV